MKGWVWESSNRKVLMAVFSFLVAVVYVFRVWETRLVLVCICLDGLKSTWVMVDWLEPEGEYGYEVSSVLPS